jgi:ATP synthase protein I
MVRAVLDGLPHCGAIRVKPLSLEDLTSPAGIFFAAVGAGSLGMSDDPEKDEAELQARLAKLGEALKSRDAREAAERAAKPNAQSSGFAKAMSAGLSVFSEFVAAVIVGAGIGWLVDRWTGATPWGLVVFLGLGAAAGFWNVYRLALRQQAQQGQTKDEG